MYSCPSVSLVYSESTSVSCHLTCCVCFCQDVQWNDIDYMDQYKDWTYSQQNYKDLPNIVKDLHQNKQRYIIMAVSLQSSFFFFMFSTWVP